MLTVDVRYDEALRGLAAYAQSLAKGALKEIHSGAAYEVARRVANLVKLKYRTHRTHIPTTFREMLIRGKATGAERPARRPMAASELGMKHFARFVTLTKLAEGYRIQIDPAARHASGKSMAEIAAMLENPPAIVTLRNTLRRLAYFIVIKEGRGGYGTRKRNWHMPDRNWGKPIVYRPRPKPVWKAVIKDLLSPQMRAAYSRDLLNRLRRAAASFPGVRLR